MIMTRLTKQLRREGQVIVGKIEFNTNSLHKRNSGRKNQNRVIASIEFLSSDDQEKPRAAKPPWPKECRRAQRKHRILTPALGSNNVCIYESLGTI